MGNITITLKVKELVYDVQVKTYLTGRSRFAGNNHEQVANMQANLDEENSNQIMRSIQNAFAQLKAKLSEYITQTIDSAGLNDDLQTYNESETLSVTLQTPSNYNNAGAPSVAAAMHEFIVNTAVAEWFNITNKPDAAEYIALAAAKLEQIREGLNKRIAPTRSTT